MAKVEETKPVNKGGRPREWDRLELAEKMLEWSLLPDSTNLLGFSDIYCIPPQKVSCLARDDEGFRLAFQLVKARVGMRRERALSKGQLHLRAYDLNAAVYDYHLKEERRDEMAYQASLKKLEEEDTAEQKMINEKYLDLMAQMASLQAMALNKADTSKRAEDKS